MFRAFISNGHIVLPASLIKWAREHEGERVVIHEDKPTRSQSQNAYYWAYLEIIARETGDNVDDLHEFFKRKLLPPVFKTIRGEEIRLPGSTRDLEKSAFSEYLDKIAALTGVPLPDPEAAGYISNYEPIKKAA
jgi:hypothetical protein